MPRTYKSASEAMLDSEVHLQGLADASFERIVADARLSVSKVVHEYIVARAHALARVNWNPGKALAPVFCDDAGRRYCLHSRAARPEPFADLHMVDEPLYSGKFQFDDLPPEVMCSLPSTSFGITALGPEATFIFGRTHVVRGRETDSRVFAAETASMRHHGKRFCAHPGGVLVGFAIPALFMPSLVQIGFSPGPMRTALAVSTEPVLAAARSFFADESSWSDLKEGGFRNAVAQAVERVLDRA